VSDCEYCYDDEPTSVCEAKSGALAHDGYVCTRPSGHDGPHVSCAPASDIHQLAAWGDDLEEVVEA